MGSSTICHVDFLFLHVVLCEVQKRNKKLKEEEDYTYVKKQWNGK